ncbi:hypothetical protein [Actinacidiphila paucisporea]|uniref:Uncharacterized protein n=1 Tax=Actinacidiphila paucisporea TaxID=310782 RepID=A0A1M7PB95_9ACTN|nr:hypothetical protein [Actinacidiphila paucisporea]SHN14060.1 hypothetical protein SAMN05216499_12258 [Actinacidiphila paucisporea]
MLLTELLVWLVQQGLENRYGPVMGAGLLFCGIGSRSRRHGTQAWCAGGILIALAYLAQH